MIKGPHTYLTIYHGMLKNFTLFFSEKSQINSLKMGIKFLHADINKFLISQGYKVDRQICNNFEDLVVKVTETKDFLFS